MYNRNKILNIKVFSRKFWNEIRKLGPSNKNQNKIENIVRINGNLVSDEFLVSNKWFKDFSKLYSGPQENINEYDLSFMMKFVTGSTLGNSG